MKLKDKLDLFISIGFTYNTENGSITNNTEIEAHNAYLEAKKIYHI
jgi:hypothetical protein